MVAEKHNLEPAAKRSRRILVVEDDPDIREAIAELLTDDGYIVTEAENGQQAIAALRTSIAAHAPMELIVLDLMMPVMDGWQFRIEQKRDPELSRIPVLVISADESAKAGAIDADYFIRKPFDVRDLQHGVKEILTLADRRAEQARYAQTDRLASIGLLAAGVSHEINNPLSYVITNLDYLAAEMSRLMNELSPGRLSEITQAIAEARDGAGRVQRIVRNMSTFSRVQEEHRGPLELHKVLELAINMVWNEIRHRGRLVKEYGPVPVVDADEARLAQVFINILVNAAQALDEKKSDTNQITVVARTDTAGWAVVEITDTGHGIGAPDLPRIFDPFFSTRPVGSGSGLGLYTSYGIITGLKGRIEVESQLGRGTTFIVKIPPSVTGTPDQPRSLTSGKPIGTSKRGRVMVIDDEPLICATLRRALSSQHEVVALTSAEEALERLQRGERFDLIFCDLMMPHMSGMELYEKMEAEAPEMIARVVFLTGGAFTPRAREFLDKVPNVRIEKPFRIDELRMFVRERLDEQKS